MPQRILIFLLSLLILPDIYLYVRFITGLTAEWWLRLLYWLPSLLLTAGILFLVCFSDAGFIVRHGQTVGWFAILLFLFAVPKFLLTVCTLVGTPFHKWLHCPQAPFVCTGLLLEHLFIVFILYGALAGRTRFVTKEVTYSSSRLPQAFDGYRIVQISDLHTGSWKGNISAVRKIVSLVNGQHPDLIVFTGDLVNHLATELDGLEGILSGLKATDGVYSVLGNHDYAPYIHWENKREQARNLDDLKRREAAMGWTLLNNAHVLLVHGNDSIALIGVENDGEPPFSQYANLPKATEGTKGLFRILLSHNPTHWRREVLPESDIDLMLAGHTHAMQLQIGRHSPSSYIYPEWGGMYMEGARGLYVNVGLGYVGIPFRFGAWPEITVLTLRKQP